jgi:hypothetical protein
MNPKAKLRFTRAHGSHLLPFEDLYRTSHNLSFLCRSNSLEYRCNPKSATGFECFSAIFRRVLHRLAGIRELPEKVSLI